MIGSNQKNLPRIALYDFLLQTGDYLFFLHRCNPRTKRIRAIAESPSIRILSTLDGVACRHGHIRGKRIES